MKNPENIFVAPESKEKILKIFASLRHDFLSLEDDFFDKKITRDLYLSLQEKALKDFFEKYRDQLRSVFKTSTGSWYFWSKLGLCLRVKKSDSLFNYKVQPVMSKLYFVSAENYNKVRKDCALMEVADLKISTVDLDLGVHPLELSVVDSGEIPRTYRILETSFEDKKNINVIFDRSQNDYFRPCPLHIGHAISEIIY